MKMINPKNLPWNTEPLPNSPTLSQKEINDFQHLIWDFYKKNRRVFPWRETTDPYKIMVSELMLQQTQTHRVVPKYDLFIKTFPTIGSLAQSNLTEVLTLWSGLGYNRRAKFLHQAAIYIHTNLKNSFPKTIPELKNIPGIGPYTASAILVFSFNIPLNFIETNIRRIFIHHFFPEDDQISDNQLFPLIAQTIDHKNPRQWYYALMDYGSNLPKKIKNPNHKSKHYTKQSKFEGSIRKVRGEILRQLLKKSPHQSDDLEKKISPDDPLKFQQALKGLEKDHMLMIKNKLVSLK